MPKSSVVKLIILVLVVAKIEIHAMEKPPLPTFSLSLLSESYFDIGNQHPHEFISPHLLSQRLDLLLLHKEQVSSEEEKSQLRQSIKNNFVLLCDCMESYYDSNYQITNPFSIELLITLNVLSSDHVIKNEAKGFYVPEKIEQMNTNTIYTLTATAIQYLQETSKSIQPTRKHKRGRREKCHFYQAYYEFFNALNDPDYYIECRPVKDILINTGLVTSAGKVYRIIHKSWDNYRTKPHSWLQ